MSAADDTIFALATAPGRAAIAIVRISGAQAMPALRRLRRSADMPAPRVARPSALYGAAGERLDQALVLCFPAPHSYTGEDVVELHLHGGRAVVGGVLETLAALPGLRPAEPGELTRRGFENGKLDLTAAEAVADLIAADTAAQRRQALRQLEGGLADLYEGWRERLLRSLAWLEADIDFSDEDLPGDVADRVRPDLLAVRAELGRHLADGRRGEILRDGAQIAIVGPPNAGKSSLMNALARREVAIVAETAGTTRDVIEVRLDLGGLPVTLADTAGLRETADAVESEGVRRAQARAGAADLVVLVLDATVWPQVDAATRRIAAERGPDLVAVLNKTDLRRPPAGAELDGHPLLPLCVRRGEGLTALLEAIEGRLRERLDAAGEAPPLTRLRHRRALEDCIAALDRFATAAQADLAAEDVRLAVRALGRITGRVDVEDLLDVIFRDFCIGK